MYYNTCVKALNTLTKILFSLIAFLSKSVTFFAGGNSYKPIIPPYTERQMRYYGISYAELLGAFRSSKVSKARALNATQGIANYYGKVVGAIYRKDQHNPNEWVIIGCWAYQKKSSDYLTGRRYWQRRVFPRGWKKKFRLF